MTVKQEFIVENLRFVPGEWCEGVPAQFVNCLPKLEVIRNEHYQEIMEMSHLLAGMQRYFPMLSAMQHH